MLPTNDKLLVGGCRQHLFWLLRRYFWVDCDDGAEVSVDTDVSFEAAVSVNADVSAVDDISVDVDDFVDVVEVEAVGEYRNHGET